MGIFYQYVRQSIIWGRFIVLKNQTLWSLYPFRGGSRTPPPPFKKREKTLRVCARKRHILVLNSYPDPPLSEILYPPLPLIRISPPMIPIDLFRILHLNALPLREYHSPRALYHVLARPMMDKSLQYSCLGQEKSNVDSHQDNTKAILK